MCICYAQNDGRNYPVCVCAFLVTIIFYKGLSKNDGQIEVNGASSCILLSKSYICRDLLILQNEIASSDII